MATSLGPATVAALHKRDNPAGATTSTHGILRPQEVRQRIDLRRYSPSSRTGRFVERYWSVSWDLPPGETYEVSVVPHPCVNLAFMTGAGGHVHGVGTGRATQVLSGSGSVFGVKFRPGGFSAGTGVVAAALTDRSAAVASAWPAAARLTDPVLAADRDQDRVTLVEDFLTGPRGLPARVDAGYALVLRMVAGMLTDRGTTRVDQVARRHRLSVRTVQRLFHRYVGVGPKWVIRRYRMHDGAERLASGTVTDPAALAVALGWFDQAHFTRDFTALIGVSPMEYAAVCTAAGGAEPLLVAPAPVPAPAPAPAPAPPGRS